MYDIGIKFDKIDMIDDWYELDNVSSPTKTWAMMKSLVI